MEQDAVARFEVDDMSEIATPASVGQGTVLFYPSLLLSSFRAELQTYI